MSVDEAKAGRALLRDERVDQLGDGILDAERHLRPAEFRAYPMTPQRYAACGHVVASRRGASTGSVDDALHQFGLRREIVAIVAGFLDGLNIARCSDLIALVPDSSMREGGVAAQKLRPFDLPVTTPDMAISMMWHPRLDADPPHRWLRENVVATCRAAA